MVRVLILHGGLIPHYRVPIYGYLRQYLQPRGFDLQVLSEGIQADNPHEVYFPCTKVLLSALSVGRVVRREKIDVVVLFVDMRHLYLFPTYLITKVILGRKLVWWGQGRDLANRDATIKNLAYATEHALCDAVILYAEHLRKYVSARYHKKVFIANNTLHLTYPGLPERERRHVLARYGIRTKKNVICVGRMQERKRLARLVDAVALMNRADIGVILVGPDTESILGQFEGDTVYKLGAVYGNDKFDLLSAADVYCLPGAVGLSIVDAFYCGLPFVTEDGDESAEITYLQNGVNGFSVQRGNVRELSDRLLLLLDNDDLRRDFSEAGRREIAERGSIDQLCAGFQSALEFATREDRKGPSEVKRQS